MRRSKVKIVMIRVLLVVLWLFSGCLMPIQAFAFEEEEFRNKRDLQRIVLIPPKHGMYLGQTELHKGNVQDFEAAISRKVAIFGSLDVVLGMEESGETPVTLNVEKANQLWNKGYIFYVGAYEATPGHRPFTVDKLLSGVYDDILHKLALQFKQFGKPMIFGTAREPNGVLATDMGGFGPTGEVLSPPFPADTDFYKNQFDISKFDIPGNPDLLKGLGDDTVCDGLERFVAAHRYYYDFFVRREGIHFLTFETMGWAADIPASLRGGDMETGQPTCTDFPLFLRLLEGYYDWVTINWYMVGESADDVFGAAEAPVPEYLETLEKLLKEVRQAAPGKPVLISELGISCGVNRPTKINAAFNRFIEKYPEIKGFTHWGGDPQDHYSCGTKPGTRGATALKEYMDKRPEYFHSCAEFSDGSRAPGC